MDPLRTGFAFALTVAFGYAACTLLFWAFPDAAATFMNALFHGLDFRKLQSADGFTVGGFAVAGLMLAAWAFLLGCVFGLLRRYFVGSSRVTV